MKEIFEEYGAITLGAIGALAMFLMIQIPLLSEGGGLCQLISLGLGLGC